MCGIFGILEHDRASEPDERRLQESGQLLTHRGPDHAATFKAPGIGLVHTRLSLLDPGERSHQPFWDRTGRFAIVYNGEIYNFKELRAGLEREGVAFRTTSDTEVLLESFVHRGLEETLGTLEGMYAFAIYDRKVGSVSLARDRFGIKPLFLFEDAQAFLFASELKAFTPWRRFELDSLRAAGYLLELGGFNRGSTLMKGVRMMDPGTIIHWSPGKPSQLKRFFSLTDLWDNDQREDVADWGPDRIVDEVESSLLSAVEMQQVADAPVGALCSGGVDSSLTVAMATRFHSDIKVFHANGVGGSSELPFARAIAEHLGLDLLVTDVTDQDHIDLLPETILHRSSPFLDLPSSIPFLKLSRLVGNHEVKAVLTGEGADEAFWGFPRMIPNPLRFARHAPRRILGGGIRFIQRLVGQRPPPTPVADGAFAKGLFARFDTALEDSEIRESITAKAPGGVKPRDYQSLHELAHNLRSLLNRNDGCGMAASVESRFPYLDHSLVKLVVNLPSRRKIRYALGGRNPAHRFVVDKWILRRVADRYMPRKLSRRPKVPWPSEAHDRMRIPESYFERSFVRELFEFSDKELGFLLENSPQRLKLKLLHLEVWAQMFLNDSSPDEQVQILRKNITIQGV